eukprot:5659755-Ditylum_brightwellii.AAC.1
MLRIMVSITKEERKHQANFTKDWHWCMKVCALRFCKDHFVGMVTASASPSVAFKTPYPSE